MKGDCFSCASTATCQETNVARVLTDYTCPLYKPVTEPVYLARVTIRVRFGEVMAAEAILNRAPELEGESGNAAPAR